MFQNIIMKNGDNMKNKTILFLTLLLLSVFLISSISAEENNTDEVLTVNETTDDVVQEDSDETASTESEEETAVEVTTSTDTQGRITATQEVSKSTAKVGDTVTFKITIKNTGNVAFDLVRVTPTGVSDGLVFKSYSGASWNSEPDAFLYSETLQPGESTVLYLTYTVTKTGQLQHSVLVTTENSNDVSLTSSVEVPDSTHDNDEHGETRVVDTRNTGNPILLLALAVLSIIPLRRFK